MTTDARQLDAAAAGILRGERRVLSDQGEGDRSKDSCADWKRQYLRLAYDQASKSPDPSNQNGAVLVLNGTGGGWGHNTFTPGIEYSETKLADRDWKLAHIEHAERNAIFDAASNGKRTLGGVLVCPWAACSDCARAIAMSGIRKVIVHQQRMDMTPERWKASVEVGLNIIRKCGAVIEYVDAKIGGNPIIVNGELWYP